MVNKLNCPVCESVNLVNLFEISNVPVHQNYLFKTKEDAIKIHKGDLEIKLCKNCGFIFNAAFDNSKLQYGESYENTQDISEVFSKYVDKEIEFLINELDIKNKKVIEVGCGKGTFLKKLIQRSESTGVGFDPSYVGEDEVLDSRLKFRRCFYDESCSDVEADIVICRHVIEHIEEPIKMLCNVRMALAKSPNAIVFFETPNIKWILENKVMYDFFYEHCSYFSGLSITKAFEIAGFSVKKIIHEFNEQYMWIIAEIPQLHKKTNGDNQQEIINLVKLSDYYSNYISNSIERLSEKIITLSNKSKVAVWGAGAKGVTFLNILDPEKLYINCVIDINFKKQGGYLPGTGHEIVSYKNIKSRKIDTIILMNSNYKDEVISILEFEDIKARLYCAEDLL